MKILKYVLASLAVVCAFLLGLLLFAPWQTIGIYALDSLRLDAAKSGVYVNYDGFDTSGGFSPEYRMRTFDVETPMARISLSDVRVGVLPFSSALSAGGACRVDFAGGTVTLVPNNKLELGSGHVKLGATRETFRAEDTRFSGDIQLTGDLVLDLRTKKIIDSSIAFTVPEQLDAMLRNPLLSRFIESNENGGWRIRYEAQNK